MGVIAAAHRVASAARRGPLLAALIAGLWLSLPADQAAPAGELTIRGASPGSHLRLTPSGNHLVVDGWLAASGSDGCRREHGHVAVCPLGGVDSINVVMGPHGDMVEVLRKLPVPLTIYLGDGSDKFIGNGERDTCYSEGARRNRCVGGPADDICITGNQNSDCVGGEGDDYCETGAGSDGCWGGPGDDVCRMGSGQDGCHGEGGSDRLFGGPNPDRLYGGGGSDRCDGGPGWGRSEECESGPGR
jgi:hypothetical protein